MIDKIKELLNGIEGDRTEKNSRRSLARIILEVIVSEEKARHAKLMQRCEAFEAKGWDYIAKDRIRLCYDMNEQGTAVWRKVSDSGTEEHLERILLIRDGEVNLYQKQLDALQALPHITIRLRDELNPNYLDGYCGWPEKQEVLAIIESIKVDMVRRAVKHKARAEVLNRLDALLKPFFNAESLFALILSPADEPHIELDRGEYMGFRTFPFALLSQSEVWPDSKVREVFGQP